MLRPISLTAPQPQIFREMHSFFDLIDQLDECAGEERSDIEVRIRKTFETERAVLALDMSGYSFSVQRDGILSHLCKIRRMQRLTVPIIERFGGEVVRLLADNVLAVFHRTEEAIESAIAINEAVRTSRNEPDGRVLDVAIGIDYGAFLLVPDHDCFGGPVNIAYKLGEDVAEAGEILVTDNARKRLTDPLAFSLDELTLTISGIELRAHKLSVAAE